MSDATMQQGGCHRGNIRYEGGLDLDHFDGKAS
jgi:hypothetical protein